jgi:hypothetical protein
MPRLAPPDPALVRDYVDLLQAKSDVELADELSHHLRDQVDVARLAEDEPYPSDLPSREEIRAESAAFSSPEVVRRSIRACQYLQSQVRVQLEADAAKNPRWARNAKLFKNTVQLEQRRLEVVVAGLAAQDGVILASPNPRGRAMEELKESHCDSCGVSLAPQFLRILREQEEKAVERRRAQREAMRAKAGKKPRTPNGRPGQRPGGAPRPA